MSAHSFIVCCDDTAQKPLSCSTLQEALKEAALRVILAGGVRRLGFKMKEETSSMDQIPWKCKTQFAENLKKSE